MFNLKRPNLEPTGTDECDDDSMMDDGMMDGDGGYEFHSTNSYCSRMFFPKHRIAVLAGYLRHVLNGIGGYWRVLASSGGQ